MRRLVAATVVLLCIGSVAAASGTQTVQPPYAGGTVFGPEPVVDCEDPALDCDAIGTSSVDDTTGDVHLGLEAFVGLIDGETATSSGLRRARASVSKTARLLVDIHLDAGLRSHLSGIASATQSSHVERVTSARGASARASFKRKWTCTTLSGQRCSVTVRRDRRFGFDIMTIAVGGGRRCLTAPETVTLAYELTGSASVRSLARASVDVNDQIGQLQLTQPDC